MVLVLVVVEVGAVELEITEEVVVEEAGWTGGLLELEKPVVERPSPVVHAAKLDPASSSEPRRHMIRRVVG